MAENIMIDKYKSRPKAAETPIEFKKSADFAERLYRLRNYQSKDFWAMLFARPLTILFLLPIIELKWVTPNRVTIASVVSKMAGAACLAFAPSYWGGVAGALLMNLGLVLDNMDGTIARYRGCGTSIGFFFDKASDMVGHLALFLAFGWRAHQADGSLLCVLVPMLAFAAFAISGYCKWIAEKIIFDIELLKSKREHNLENLIDERTDYCPVERPPQRTPLSWLKWLGQAFASILKFNEVDIFFWALVAALAGREEIFTLWASGAYSLGVLIGPIYFGVKLLKYESGK